MRPTIILAVALIVALALAASGDSNAAFPGTNGSIVFDSDRFDDEQIFVIGPSGGPAEQLTTEGRNYSPAWSADGTRIAFISERSGGGDVWVMNADGSEPTNLTNDVAGLEAVPAWSPDGSTIVYNRRILTVLDIEIWTVPANGGSPAPLLQSPGTDSTAAFSPDGTRIAFGRSVATDQDLDIYVANADGSNAVQLTDNDATDFHPNWSPDGERIAYNCAGQSGAYEVCVLDADDGGNQQILTPDADVASDPSWSPDGTRIVFESVPLVGGTAGIYTMDPSGGDVQPVTVESDYEPDWGTLPVVLVQGDVDCDGDVDEDDMSLLLEFIAFLTDGEQPGLCPDVNELEPLTNRGWGNLNCDGFLNGLDAILVILYMAELGPPEPIGGCFPVGDPIILTS